MAYNRSVTGWLIVSGTSSHNEPLFDVWREK